MDDQLEEIESIRKEFEAMTDKWYDENNELIPGAVTDADRKRHRELMLRLRELQQ